MWPTLKTRITSLISGCSPLGRTAPFVNVSSFTLKQLRSLLAQLKPTPKTTWTLSVCLLTESKTIMFPCRSFFLLLICFYPTICTSTKHSKLSVLIFRLLIYLFFPVCFHLWWCSLFNKKSTVMDHHPFPKFTKWFNNVIFRNRFVACTRTHTHQGKIKMTAHLNKAAIKQR